MDKSEIPLNESIRLIILQFSFKNANNVPLGVRERAKETPKERKQRTSRSIKGEEIFPRAEKTEIILLDGLEKAGYEMVDAFWITRIDPKGGTYPAVRFTFVQKQYARPSDEFKKTRDNARLELERMCHLALWRSRGYLNPYFQNREELPGVSAVSINLEVRDPRFHGDGTPFVKWFRDGDGSKIGEDPNPVTPFYKLIVEEGCIRRIAV